MKAGKVLLLLIVIIVLVWLAMSLFRASQNGAIQSEVVNLAPTIPGEVTTDPTPTIPSASEPMESYTTSSGLAITVLTPGSGEEAQKGNTVSVNYTGTFADGKAFDSNIDPAFGHVEPFTFVLGAGMVIKGWDEGVAGMKIGEKRKLVIPYTLAYGENGYGPIPPKAELTFEVELVSIQ